jgi:fatty acid-binding protein DegV
MSDKIILVSDSSCDLSQELIKEHDIRIIPLHVNFDGTEYDDGVNIDLIKMFAKYPSRKILEPNDTQCFR